MNYIKIIDQLTELQKYLIQRHINHTKRQLRAMNCALRLLEAKRSETEANLIEAVERRSGLYE